MIHCSPVTLCRCLRIVHRLSSPNCISIKSSTACCHPRLNKGTRSPGAHLESPWIRHPHGMHQRGFLGVVLLLVGFCGIAAGRSTPFPISSGVQQRRKYRCLYCSTSHDYHIRFSHEGVRPRIGDMEASGYTIAREWAYTASDLHKAGISYFQRQVSGSALVPRWKIIRA